MPCDNQNQAATCFSTLYEVNGTQLKVTSTFTGGGGCNTIRYLRTIDPDNGDPLQCDHLDLAAGVTFVATFTFAHVPGSGFTATYDPGANPGGIPLPQGQASPCASQNDDSAKACFTVAANRSGNRVTVRSTLKTAGPCPGGRYLRTVDPNNGDPVQCDVFSYRKGSARLHTFTFASAVAKNFTVRHRRVGRS